MICTLTARRLKAGEEEAFRATFTKTEEGIPAEVNQRRKKVYVTRDVTDPDVLLTFGFFDRTIDELGGSTRATAATTRSPGSPPTSSRCSSTGSYEVVEEINP